MPAYFLTNAAVSGCTISCGKNCSDSEDIAQSSMQLIKIKTDEEFKIIGGTERSQAAIMVMEPFSSTGGPDNKHEHSDQWLFVTSGHGKAIVAGEEVALAENSLLLIEAGETHEIKNTSDKPLRTLNFYCPPQY